MTLTETALTAYHIARKAKDYGVDLELPVGVDGLTGPELQERHLAASTLHLLWEKGIDALGDPLFPVRCATYPLSEARSFVLFAATSMPTIGEAMEVAIRFWALASSDVTLTRELHGSDVLLVFGGGRGGGGVGARAAREFHVADAVRASRTVTGGSWVPREVRFSHRPTVPVSAYEDALGVPVRFGAERCEIVSTRESLDAPITAPTPMHVAHFFEATVQAMLARRTRPVTLVERVEAFVDRELDGGEPTLERAAHDVAMSERSLHRHLAACGRSFREIVDETRRRRALELLAVEPAAPLGQVASTLGFSDVRAFARAFRRWTGRSPRAALACAA